jgi:hypothetical protein
MSEEQEDESNNNQDISVEKLLGIKRSSASAIFPDFMWLGSGRDASDLEMLVEHKITHILNVADDVPNYFPGRFTYRNLNVADFGSDPGISRVFESAFEFIQHVQSCNGRVLIHCAAGVNRSATVVVASIMHFHGKSLREAFEFVLKKRRIYPLKDNREELIRWEASKSSNGATMEFADFDKLLRQMKFRM